MKKAVVFCPIDQCRLLLLLIIVVTIPNLYASPEIDYQLIKPDELLIGTPFTLQVSISSAIDADVHYPVRDTIGVFAVLNADKKTVVSADKLPEAQQIPPDKKITNINFLLAAFKTGEQRIPPLRFEIYNEEARKTETLSTPAIPVEIYSVLPDSIGTIKDIAPPLRIHLKFWDYFLPLLIIALIVALIFIISKKMKKPLKEALPEIEEDPRPDYVKALELLENLKKRKLLEKGEYIEFHYRLSLILRIFLELHYRFKAVEMTTAEIDSVIKERFSTDPSAYQKLPSFKQYKEVMELLRYTDLVKFAKYNPVIQRSLESLEWLEKYFRSFASSTENTSHPDS